MLDIGGGAMSDSASSTGAAGPNHCASSLGGFIKSALASAHRHLGGTDRHSPQPPTSLDQAAVSALGNIAQVLQTKRDYCVENQHHGEPPLHHLMTLFEELTQEVGQQGDFANPRPAVAPIRDMLSASLLDLGWSADGNKLDPASPIDRRPPWIAEVLAFLNRDLERVNQALSDLHNNAASTQGQQPNYCIPHTCFIYRDGVAENQIDDVKKQECEVINFAFEEVANAESQPHTNVVYMIVNKDSKTRLLLRDTQGKSHNPPPGTVSDIISAASGLVKRAEFFMVPAPCDLSTAKPVRYIVVQNQKANADLSQENDEPVVQLDDIKNLTYAMCWVYPNWPGPVKVPFVCQCAAKLAKLYQDIGDRRLKTHPNLQGGYYYL